jgi:hypothetical protein
MAVLAGWFVYCSGWFGQVVQADAPPVLYAL